VPNFIVEFAGGLSTRMQMLNLYVPLPVLSKSSVDATIKVEEDVEAPDDDDDDEDDDKDDTGDDDDDNADNE
jgi:hypothetical protein